MVILTYHKINDVANFEKQLSYLVKNKYNLLSLSDFLLRYSSQSFTSRDILISFDDGDYSFVENAMPVLVRHSCPAVVFVVTSLIGTSQPFWWDEIIWYTNDVAQVRRAKLLSNNERLLFLQKLRAKSDKPSFHYRQLTLDELKIMERNNISVANHSHTHPMFNKLDKREIEEELQSSSSFLRTNGLSAPDVFAFPNGNSSEVSESVLKEQGFKFAFLFDHKVQRNIQNPLRISRLSVSDNTPLWKFKLILSGLHSAMLPIIKTIHKVRS